MYSLIRFGYFFGLHHRMDEIRQDGFKQGKFVG